MKKELKPQVVETLGARLSGAKCLYLTDFTGLDVDSINALRRRLSAAGVEYVVVKNTLARRAIANTRYADLAEHLEGPSAFAMSSDDVVGAAKVLTDFARERDRPRIKGGAIEGNVVSLEEIRRIAELPPREELLAQAVGYARAPIAGLVYTLSGLLSKFVRTVDAVRRQLDTGGPSEGTSEGEPPGEPEGTEE